MAKASYWQRGESLDFKNNTNAKVEANTIIALAGRIGVAGGVFEMAKTGTSAIAQGAAVYWDGDGITDTASSNTPAGYAAADAAAADTTILVKLQG